MNLENHAVIQPFSIWTKPYEANCNEKSHIDLDSLQNNCTLPNTDFSKKGLILYGSEKNSNSRIDKILEKYKDVSDFCSMQLGSTKELLRHIDIIYDLMYHHYAIGKKNDFLFPKGECNPSSQNIMIASMLKSYPNASVIASEFHAYNAFPFILHNTKGFIIADPTSDQLGESNKNNRNKIFVAKHNNWEYETDWNEEQDLFPIEFQNLRSLRSQNWEFDDYCKKIKTYFNEVFKNPVKVQIDSI